MSTHDPAPAATWIWSARSHPGQYLRFRRLIALSHQPASARLAVSAETDFAAFVNGRLAGFGQLGDWPERKTATTIEVAHLLRPGRNILAIAAYHNGQGNSVYCPGCPGIIAQLSGDVPEVSTGPDWRCAEDSAYRQGEMPIVTLQMGRVFERDARRDEPWLAVDFDDAGWAEAVPTVFTPSGRPSLRERPIPALDLGDPMPARLVGCGHFIRTRRAGTVAEQMASDALVACEPQEFFAERRPPVFYDAEPAMSWYGRRLSQPDGTTLTLPSTSPGSDGQYVIIDLGRVDTGYLTLRLTAPAGTVIDLGHGEHLRRGRVATSIGGRNFADRFICTEGVNEFTHWFRRLGCRYIEAHVHGAGGPVRIDYVGLRPSRLPGLQPVQQFDSSDEMLDRIGTIAVRTLELSALEDCPWREQGRYAFDVRNQALFGYQVTGNYTTVAASLSLFADGIRPDGWLPLCAPARLHLTIPVFSLVWIGAIAEHWLYSGDEQTAKRHRATIDRILAVACADPDPASGLYRTPTGCGIWNFYEWSDGLSSRIPDETEVVRPADGRFDAPYNLHLLEAIGDAAWIHRRCGDRARAERLEAIRAKLADAVLRAFWDEDRTALASFRTGLDLATYAELTQALALTTGILPPRQASLVAAKLVSGALTPATLSSMRYLGAALSQHSPQTRHLLESIVRRTWGAMLCAGATTFWETAHGADDFDGAGSLCHGWSAFPAYFTGAIHLGIRPTEPGFARFQVAPFAGRLHQASGAIPTPLGSIHITWQRERDGLAITMTGPPGLEPVLRPLPECPIASATYNGGIPVTSAIA
jgi:alpha-L-rhamnosidase